MLIFGAAICSGEDCSCKWPRQPKGHPSCRNDLVSKGGHILYRLIIHQVRGASNLDDDLVGADGVVEVLKVEAVGEIGVVLEDIEAGSLILSSMDRACRIVRVRSGL